MILSGIFNGNAGATSLTIGEVQMLNLQDPDSMIVDSLGELVMISDCKSGSEYLPINR